MELHVEIGKLRCKDGLINETFSIERFESDTISSMECFFVEDAGSAESAST